MNYPGKNRFRCLPGINPERNVLKRKQLVIIDYMNQETPVQINNRMGGQLLKCGIWM
jgi:hypothetical protein